MKKKLIIVTHYWRGINGGISSHLTRFYNAFKKYSNYDINIFFIEGYSKSKKEIKFHKNKIIFMIEYFLKLLKFKPDIVHTHGPWYTNLPTALYKFFYPNTMIVQTHHTDPDKYLKGFKKNIYEKILSFYDYNVFFSRYLMNKFSYYNIKSKKIVIYGAIDISTFKAKNVSTFIKKYGIKKDDKIITYIGNFAWDLKSRGVDLLIKSLDRALQKDKKIKLIIIGNGKYIERSKTLVKELNISDRVKFIGNQKNVFTALSISKIHLHITYQDSFSYAIIEAMSSKIPVIASNHGAMRELIINNKTGILVRNDDKEISKAILSLLKDPKKRYELSKTHTKD